ncbi:MAG: alanine/glycine:cation symporter family protein [Akkermansiaceae bacterium]
MITHRLSSIFRYLLLLPLLISSAWAEDLSWEEKIDGWLAPVATTADSIVFYSFQLGGQSLPIILVILGGTAVFLTIYFKFLNLRSIGLALRTVRGKYTDADAPGQITHFQALTAALSATVGLGNIAGVAVAIGIGGPGATFWMVMMGLCGMTTKFCECTLGVKYRKIDAEGKVSGGAMYYLSQGLAERGLGGLGKFLAIFFAVMCVGGAFGAGNLFQVNQATSQVVDSFGVFQGQDGKIWFGVILAVLVGMVIIGGIVWIARVTSFLVPFMCGAYMIVALIIIASHIDQLGAAFQMIVQGAFSPMAVGGGIVGVLIQGIKRAAFSNEAGIGSAPIAHAAVKTKKPASEGLVALLEPFTDTVVVCTMTALVLIITGVWKVDAVVKQDTVSFYKTPAMEEVVGSANKGDELRIIGKEGADDVLKLGDRGQVLLSEVDGQQETAWVNYAGLTKVEGIGKTSRAFGEKFASFPKLLAVAVLLFAFSTMISWSYYGEQAVIYLCGGRKKGAVLAYKLIFCALTVVGAAASMGNIVMLSDAMIFAMVIPNMFGLYLLLPVVKSELAIFLKHVAEIDGK